MRASILALVIDLALFGLGLYVYLFARGIVKLKDNDTGKRARAFRDENKTWLRLLGLALAAIMAMNLFFQVKEMMA